MSRRVASIASPVSSHRRSLIRRASHQDDLARARRQTPAEKLKTALELSELCLRLKKAVQASGSGHGKS